MLSIDRIIIYVCESLALTAVIYILAKKTFKIKELAVLAISIMVVFMVLDMFAPGVSSGVRQGSGFGLGYAQIAGSSYPRRYFDPNTGNIVEGMDDPTAINYYGNYNPKNPQKPEQELSKGPNMVTPEAQAQIPSIILQQYSKSPFGTDEDVDAKYAQYKS